MDKKEKRIIKNTIAELFKLLNIDGNFGIEEGKEGVAEVILDTKDNGIVIGYHGDTLDSLQLILSLCISKKLGKFKRVSIEVGDYKKNRMEWLKNLALATKERVLTEGQEIAIPQLKSWERRVIHLILENDEKVFSESLGEGRDRVLVVRPKK